MSATTRQGEQECETLALSCSGQAMDTVGKLLRLALECVDGLQRHLGRVCDRHRLLPAARRARAQRTHWATPSVPRRGHAFPRRRASTASASGTIPGCRWTSMRIPPTPLTSSTAPSISGWLEEGQDRLRPIDYAALPGNVEYHSHTAGVNFYSSPVPYLAIGGGFYKGTSHQLFASWKQRAGAGGGFPRLR